MGAPIRTLSDVDVVGRVVFVRVDFNVPLEDGVVQDDGRIRAAIPTLKELLGRGATLVLMSHLGRPKGPDRALVMAPVAERLGELLGVPVRYLRTEGPGSADEQAFVAAGEPGSVTMLENTRFDSRETKNDPALARVLASYADAYVNDAFGSAHRAHASTEGVARLLPNAAGRLMEAEIRALGRLLKRPERPFAVVLGGSKVSDKIGVIRHLLDLADRVLIGGAMAYTFELARGGEVGASRVEADQQEVALQVLQGAEAKGVSLLLPVDSTCAAELREGVPTSVHASDAIPDGLMGLDIGPRAIRAFRDALDGCRTVFWNGPLGVFETPPFDTGTRAIAQALAGLDAYTVVGGGDSGAAIRAAGLEASIDHVSTGGGASLELLEGRTLPGVAVLEA